MTHQEAFNQITQAMTHLSPSLADEDGWVNATIRVKFFRDPDTKQLTKCATVQDFQILRNA